MGKDRPQRPEALLVSESASLPWARGLYWVWPNFNPFTSSSCSLARVLKPAF